jgi:hypothetical protein
MPVPASEDKDKEEKGRERVAYGLLPPIELQPLSPSQTIGKGGGGGGVMNNAPICPRPRLPRFFILFCNPKFNTCTRS